MDEPIVVGVDGSASSLGAVDWGAEEAALRGAPLRLVYASLWERYEGELVAQELNRPVEEVMARDVVGTAEARARQRRPGLEVTTDVLPGEPEYALVRESRTARAVVLGSRGRSGVAEALLGSVSLTVAGHAQCPVFVLREGPGTEESGGAPRIVLAVGDEPGDAAAARFAAEEAELRGLPLEAVRAWRRPSGVFTGHDPHDGDPEEAAREAVAEALRDVPDGVATIGRTPEGHSRDALVEAARGATLLVVGAHRRHGGLGLQLGRVAHGVLHRAPCPVAVVPEQA
ncbi:universal stress protein [Streptomyces sp. NPDC048201]|uniref:universal stress protein n=1 Tax=unclassified Streptomyces TaxID=2593676 RepID=UPI00136D61B3|nr:universal stress protein [Streptomyces sp. SID4982]MYS14977.1 universal stress protein [Streptomyces sp. SID4982]